MRIVAPMPQEGGPRQNQQQKKKKNCTRPFQTTSKQKCSNVRPLLSITFPQGFRIFKDIGHPTSGSGVKKTVKKDQKPKKTKKSEEKNFFLRGDFRQFANKNVHIYDHFFPLLFPKDSESLKILDIQLREMGAKRPLNGTSKVNRHTDTRTHGHMDRRTFRLIESISQEGQCFENQRYALQPEVSNPSGSMVSTMFCKAKSAKKNTFFARRVQTTFKQNKTQVFSADLWSLKL